MSEYSSDPELHSGRYIIVKRIGKGSFGTIYQGVDTKTNAPVAIKLENKDVVKPRLHYEFKVYCQLKKGVGIPTIYYFGTTRLYNIMAMDLLGYSLEGLFNLCNRKFSLKTILMLADQMIDRLQYIHSKGFVHRDLKPENFMMGAGEDHSKLYLIDFGLAKRYFDKHTCTHIPFRYGKQMTGTARYVSTNAHMGMEQSRRDDMISLGYVFIYLIMGALPWQGLHAATKKQKYEKICEKKLSMSVRRLCRHASPEFATYLECVQQLEFDEEPQYTYVRQLFRNAFLTLNVNFDYAYDWTVFPKKTEKHGKKSKKLHQHRLPHDDKKNCGEDDEHFGHGFY